MEGIKEIIFDSAAKLWKRFYYLFIGISAILGYFFLLVGSIGMFGIGILSIDKSPEIHFIFFILVFAGLILELYLRMVYFLKN